MTFEHISGKGGTSKVIR